MDTGLNAKGVIELQLEARGVTTGIALLRESLNDTSAAGDKLEKKSRSVEAGLSRVGKTATGTAAATRSAAQSSREYESSLIRQRYALYDVATTYGIISAALLASSGYAVKLGADFESAFTSVERTSDGTLQEIQALRDGLVDLSTQMPLTFQELSKIASAGNQLGIAAKDIQSFTETVARFAAISGLSVDSVAESFGKISNLTGLATSDYEKFGSAVALVARNSASTEANLISTAKEIAASGAQAGFSAQAVVGLAGALASLSIAPERARGSLDTYFGTLNKAVAGGGQDLQNFSIVTGIAADELDRLVRNGEGQKVFTAFLQGLSELDNVAKTTALDDLNLSQLRVENSFKRMAGNLPLVTKLFADANDGFASGAELQAQYAKVLDDLNSQWMIFVNSVNALIETLSGGLVPGIAGAVGQLTEMVNAAREFADNPVAQSIAGVVVGLTTLIGVFFAYRAALALATASTYALTTANAGLAASGSALGLKGLIAALTGIGGAAGVATGKVGLLKGALVGLGKATLLLALLDVLYQMVFLWDENARGANNFLKIIGIQAPKATTMLIDLGYGAVGVQNGMYRIGKAAVSAGDLALGALAPVLFLLRLISGQFNATRNLSTRGTDHAVAGFTAAAGAADDYASSLDGVGDSGSGAAAQVRTLIDYGNDLSQVFKRAFDIRFSGAQGLDAITAGWLSVADATAQVNDEISQYRATMLSLTADRAIKEYWLSVAENYGDVLRAGVLRAELAQLDTDLTKSSQDLTKAQDKNSKSLVGNSAGAIENRATILGLVTNYQSYVTALASSGASQDELRAKAAQLKADFLAQATQLGYNNDELQQYAAAFDDVTFAINNVPRDITVTANMNPAIQALNEYLAQVNSSSASPSIGGGGSLAGSIDGSNYATAFAAAAQNVVISRGYAGRSASTLDSFFNFGGSSGISAWPFAEGGYTGSGGKYEPKGVVHGGEFVFSKKATQNIGVGNLAFAHKMAKRGYAEGGYVGTGFAMTPSGPGIVQLSAADRQLLVDVRRAIDRKPILAPTAIAASTSAVNANQSNRRTA